MALSKPDPQWSDRGLFKLLKVSKRKVWSKEPKNQGFHEVWTVPESGFSRPASWTEGKFPGEASFPGKLSFLENQPEPGVHIQTQTRHPSSQDCGGPLRGDRLATGQDGTLAAFLA